MQLNHDTLVCIADLMAIDAAESVHGIEAFKSKIYHRTVKLHIYGETLNADCTFRLAGWHAPNFVIKYIHLNISWKIHSYLRQLHTLKNVG